MPPSTVKTLIEIMGDRIWDIHTLSTEFNKRRKYGPSPAALAQKMASNKEFHVVGTTAISTIVRRSPKKGYKLWAVKPQYLEVLE